MLSLTLCLVLPKTKTLSPVGCPLPPPPGSATPREGTDNKLTPPPPTEPPPDNQCKQIDFAAVATAQADCPDVPMMRRSTSLQVVTHPHQGHEFYGDVSTGVFPLLLLPKFRPLAIADLHNVHHPSIRATVRLISAAFADQAYAKRIRLRESLHLMSARQSTSPCHPTARPHRRSEPPIRPPACRLSRTPSQLCRLHVHIHNSR